MEDILKRSDEMEVRVIKPEDVSDALIEKMMGFEEMFPEKIRYDRKKLESILANTDNTNILLVNGIGAVGYILVNPHNDVVAEYREKGDDAFMTLESDRCYLDKITVVPEERSSKAFLCLIHGMAKIMDTKGISKYSTHITKNNALSRVVMRFFRYTLTREPVTVNLNTFGGEPFLYIEGDYNKT